MKQPSDYKQIAESYDAIYKKLDEADTKQPAAAPSTQEQPAKQAPQTPARVKDAAGFNTNLDAIDKLEDQMINFVETAQKTGWLQGNEINAFKGVLTNILTSSIVSLLISTQINDEKQMDQMLKTIQSKIKFVDVHQIVNAYNAAKGDNAATPGAGIAGAAAAGQAPNMGQQPTSYRWQAAVDTLKNFQTARTAR